MVRHAHVITAPVVAEAGTTAHHRTATRDLRGDARLRDDPDARRGMPRRRQSSADSSRSRCDAVATQELMIAAVPPPVYQEVRPSTATPHHRAGHRDLRLGGRRPLPCSPATSAAAPAVIRDPEPPSAPRHAMSTHADRARERAEQKLGELSAASQSAAARCGRTQEAVYALISARSSPRHPDSSTAPRGGRLPSSDASRCRPPGWPTTATPDPALRYVQASSTRRRSMP
jgi:hypothetical protein